MIPFMPYKKPIIKKSLLDIKDIIKKHNIKSPLIITDKVILNNGLLKPLLDDLKEHNISYVLYDEVLPNPTNSSIEDLYLKLKDSSIDMLIAVGGGSVIDLNRINL